MQPTETNSELKIEKWIYGGDGLGRLEGKVVLAPFAIPGERVRVRITQRRPDLCRAEVEEVIEASADRVAPRCPYFGSCGGCHYQHASYELQLRQKTLVLADVFRRIAKMGIPEPLDVVSGEPWRYRNRVQLHFGEGQLGYMAEGTHRLRPVDQCPVASPKLEESITALRGMLSDRRWPRFLRSMELFTNESEIQINVLDSAQRVAKRFFEWCAERIPGSGAASLDYPAAGFVFRVSHRTFFQVNRFLAGSLVEAAVGGAAGDTAWDLYAGAGLFSLPLAKRFRRVVAVESGRGAASDLAFNAGRAGLRVEVRRCSAEDFLDNEAAPPDFVIADPPRAGLGKHNVRSLIRLKPRRLVIVACDPATLARDVAALAAGGFHLSKLTLVDLFPHTYHLETIAVLEG
jgi:23S rRNA (uracil1939-C5)-methyltransferase